VVPERSPRPERGIEQVPQQGGAPSAQPAAQQPDPSSIAIPASQPVAMPDPISNASVPMLAQDSDLIEKEWVDKAKQILQQTRSDPHLQNKEINRFKADYLKKRYNKDIKVIDE
jgi:hypothetical protein